MNGVKIQEYMEVRVTQVLWASSNWVWRLYLERLILSPIKINLHCVSIIKSRFCWDCISLVKVSKVYVHFISKRIPLQAGVVKESTKRHLEDVQEFFSKWVICTGLLSLHNKNLELKSNTSRAISFWSNLKKEYSCKIFRDKTHQATAPTVRSCKDPHFEKKQI